MEKQHKKGHKEKAKGKEFKYEKEEKEEREEM